MVKKSITIICLMILLYFWLLLFIIFRVKLTRNNYAEYDYDAENPNAIISGQVIGGTVYASSKDSPGLGWIL